MHPCPGPGSWRRARSAAQAGSSRRMRAGSISRRATLARGSRAVAIPSATRLRSRSGARTANAERGHPAHRVADEMEAIEIERVDEGREVVHQPAGLEAIGHVPARPAVPARIRQVEAEPGGEGRDLGGVRLAPDGRRGVEQHHRRTVADDVVADVEVVGADVRHRRDATAPVRAVRAGSRPRRGRPPSRRGTRRPGSPARCRRAARWPARARACAPPPPTSRPRGRPAPPSSGSPSRARSMSSAVDRSSEPDSGPAAGFRPVST